ncbi:hypothetical protein NFI96_009735 [Prochilodus magdalenae]|nr:hypothetical protein NFI96_009735 [Prochilodus magdalenae]
MDSMMGEQREQKRAINDHTHLSWKPWKSSQRWEDHSRRNNIRLVGLLEGTGGPIGLSFKKAIKDWFPSLANSEIEVERAHRVYREAKDPRNSPRVFIFKLLRYQDRQRLLKASRSHGPISSSGSALRYFVDYSAFTSRRRMSFAPIQKSLRAAGVESFLIYPAQLKVTAAETPEESFSEKIDDPTAEHADADDAHQNTEPAGTYRNHKHDPGVSTSRSVPGNLSRVIRWQEGEEFFTVGVRGYPTMPAAYDLWLQVSGLLSCPQQSTVGSKTVQFPYMVGKRAGQKRSLLPPRSVIVADQTHHCSTLSKLEDAHSLGTTCVQFGGAQGLLARLARLSEKRPTTSYSTETAAVGETPTQEPGHVSTDPLSRLRLDPVGSMFSMYAMLSCWESINLSLTTKSFQYVVSKPQTQNPEKLLSEARTGSGAQQKETLAFFSSTGNQPVEDGVPSSSLVSSQAFLSYSKGIEWSTIIAGVELKQLVGKLHKLPSPKNKNPRPDDVIVTCPSSPNHVLFFLPFPHLTREC